MMRDLDATRRSRGLIPLVDSLLAAFLEEGIVCAYGASEIIREIKLNRSDELGKIYSKEKSAKERGGPSRVWTSTKILFGDKAKEHRCAKKDRYHRGPC